MITNPRKPLRRTFVSLFVLATLISAGSLDVRGADPEFDAIARHLKVRYNARRVSIPFLGLANFFVKIVKPAGVKSVKVAVFEDLTVLPGDHNAELGLVVRNALGADWQPLARVRSRDGEQLFVYGKEAGENLSLMVVTIDRTDAVVARVKVSPKKLSEFLSNPKILGISLNR